MSDLIIPASSVALPAPRCGEVHVRLATLADIPFIDELQKKHQKMLGWTPRKTIEGKIAAGHVLVAEGTEAQRHEGTEERDSEASPSLRASVPSCLRASPLGYCISQDKYMGREDCGVVYQLNVAPVQQRKLIGATLVKTVFERAAYGCRLFCCWCAQDIAANYFWESIGFVPLAFRAGNRAKQRVHIFWQRRIREGDTTTPYWYPSETRGGMMNEARLVLPIPPGTHWKDAKPIVLPGIEPAAPQPTLPATRPPSSGKPFVRKVAVVSSPNKFLKETPPGKAAVVTASGIRYLDRADYVPPPPEPPKPKRTPKPKAKNDPKHVAAARELRDRWLEEVNSGRYLPAAQGKYDVSRALVSAPSPQHSALPSPAAAIPAPIGPIAA